MEYSKKLNVLIQQKIILLARKKLTKLGINHDENSFFVDEEKLRLDIKSKNREIKYLCNENNLDFEQIELLIIVK